MRKKLIARFFKQFGAINILLTTAKVMTTKCGEIARCKYNSQNNDLQVNFDN